MKWFIDGDQLCITGDDFIDLQESPAIFWPLTSPMSDMIIEHGFPAIPAFVRSDMEQRLVQQETVAWEL